MANESMTVIYILINIRMHYTRLLQLSIYYNWQVEIVETITA